MQPRGFTFKCENSDWALRESREKPPHRPSGGRWKNDFRVQMTPDRLGQTS